MKLPGKAEGNHPAEGDGCHGKRRSAMNYYERYCGDYQRDTAHLSLAEHGAYTMLLDTYFSVEKPLPEDLASLYRVCRAMTRLEQQAVKAVAGQFFPVSQDDGLRHNQRADREIARARPKIEAARINGRKGGRPPKSASGNAGEIRDGQSQGSGMPAGLFAALDHETGELPAAFTETHGKPGSEAHQHQPQHQHQHQHQLQSRPQTQTQTQIQHEFHRQPRQFQEEASADFKPFKPGETRSMQKGRSQQDSAIHDQEPVLKGDVSYLYQGYQDDGARGNFNSDPLAGMAGAGGSVPGPVPPGISGSCCKALISQGVTGCNPHHPTLLALLQAGATEEEFVQAARNAVDRGKASFPYVIGTVKRQREEAAKLVLHRGRMPDSQELLQTANRAATAGWVPPELRNTEEAEPAGQAEPRGPVEAGFAEADGRFSSCR
jgi:uncharacterized protein YdaU (DUF1376 family)